MARAARIHVSQLFRWRKEQRRLKEPPTETRTVFGAGDRVRGQFISFSHLAEPLTIPHPSRKRSNITVELAGVGAS